MKNQKKGSWKDYYPFTSLLIAFFKEISLWWDLIDNLVLEAVSGLLGWGS